MAFLELATFGYILVPRLGLCEVRIRLLVAPRGQGQVFMFHVSVCVQLVAYYLTYSLT